MTPLTTGHFFEDSVVWLAFNDTVDIADIASSVGATVVESGKELHDATRTVKVLVRRGLNIVAIMNGGIVSMSPLRFLAMIDCLNRKHVGTKSSGLDWRNTQIVDLLERFRAFPDYCRFIFPPRGPDVRTQLRGKWKCERDLREELGTVEQDGAGRWTATNARTSGTGNPVSNKLDTLKRQMKRDPQTKLDKFQAKYGIPRACRRLADAARSLEKVIRQEIPHYFALRELAHRAVPDDEDEEDEIGVGGPLKGARRGVVRRAAGDSEDEDEASEEEKSGEGDVAGRVSAASGRDATASPPPARTTTTRTLPSTGTGTETEMGQEKGKERTIKEKKEGKRKDWDMITVAWGSTLANTISLVDSDEDLVGSIDHLGDGRVG
ncbi:hypothetical protein Q5752_004147 [Cryptotrichosporon argae]